MVDKNVLDLNNPREKLIYDMINPVAGSRPTMAEVMTRLKKIETDEARPIREATYIVDDVFKMKVPPKTVARTKPRIFDPLPGFNKVGPYRYGWRGEEGNLTFRLIFDSNGRPIQGIS